jgi:hypothetical protein
MCPYEDFRVPRCALRKYWRHSLIITSSISSRQRFSSLISALSTGRWQIFLTIVRSRLARTSLDPIKFTRKLKESHTEKGKGEVGCIRPTPIDSTPPRLVRLLYC